MVAPRVSYSPLYSALLSPLPSFNSKKMNYEATWPTTMSCTAVDDQFSGDVDECERQAAEALACLSAGEIEICAGADADAHIRVCVHLSIVFFLQLFSLVHYII